MWSTCQWSKTFWPQKLRTSVAKYTKKRTRELCILQASATSYKTNQSSTNRKHNSFVMYTFCNWRSPLSAKTSCFIEPSAPTIILSFTLKHPFPYIPNFPKCFNSRKADKEDIHQSRQAPHSHRHKPELLYLVKTFAVETLYYCNLLCSVKCWTPLLTFKAVAMSLYHITSQTCTSSRDRSPM